MLGIFSLVQTGTLPLRYSLLALFAGCTNENLALALLAALIIAIIYRWVVAGRMERAALLSLSLLLVGSMLLIAAPGNLERLMHPSFAIWRHMSFADKFRLHLLERLPLAFEKLALAYLLVAAGFIFCLSKKKLRVFIVDKTPSPLSMAIFMAWISLVANAVMVFSLYFSPRSMTTSFIFLLFATSFIVCHMSASGYADLVGRLSVSLVISAIATYYPVLSAYRSIDNQTAIRMSILGDPNNRARGIAAIPEFFFKSIPRASYMFDSYANLPVMEKFYGYKSISAYSVDFDYSVIKTRSNYIPDNGNDDAAHEVVALWAYPDRYFMDTVLVGELSSGQEALITNEGRICIWVDGALGRIYRYSVDPNLVRIEHRTFFSITLENLPFFLVKKAAISYVPSSHPDAQCSSRLGWHLTRSSFRKSESAIW